MNTELMNFPCVKIDTVNELKGLDPSLAMLSQLVEIFHSEYSNRIPEMISFGLKNEFENLSNVTHRFRSTAYNLGATRAAEITKQIDSLISKKLVDKLQLKQLLISLEQQCVAANEILKSHLII